MSRGDAEHVAQHQHGVQARPEPAAPQTVEQRVAKLEARVQKLEAELIDARAVKVAPVATKTEKPKRGR